MRSLPVKVERAPLASLSLVGYVEPTCVLETWSMVCRPGKSSAAAMGRRAASSLQTSRSSIVPAVRAVLFTAVLASAFLALSLHAGLLGLPPTSGFIITPAATDTTTGLTVRTIVAYSMEAQLQQAPLAPCPRDDLRPPHKELSRNNRVWQTPSQNIFLLNAYYDTRVHLEGRVFPSIRIIAMLFGSHNVTLYCQVWFEAGFPPVITRVLQTEIWSDQWDASYDSAYRPFLLSCPLGQAHEQPKAVSIVEGDPCKKSSTLLAVSHPPVSRRARKVAVCVKGLDFAQDNSIRLVEWLEVNRLLGAEKFFIYLYYIHPNMKRVLKYYEGLGEIEVISLTLPGNQPNTPDKRTKFLHQNIWQKRRNELVAYNDCLYRNLHSYKFIIPLDIDEVIVPIHAKTWQTMFRQFFLKNPNALQKYSSFSVQNVYFFEEFGASNQNAPEYLHFLRYTQRSANFSPVGESCKSFVSTQNTLTVFNHYALTPIYPEVQARLLLSTEIAQMNHYKRQCSPLLSTSCRDNFLRYHKEDVLLSRYREIIQARVQVILRNLNLI